MNTLLFIPNLIYITLFHKEPNPSVQIQTQGLNYFFLDGEDTDPFIPNHVTARKKLTRCSI